MNTKAFSRIAWIGQSLDRTGDLRSVTVYQRLRLYETPSPRPGQSRSSPGRVYKIVLKYCVFKVTVFSSNDSGPGIGLMCFDHLSVFYERFSKIVVSYFEHQLTAKTNASRTTYGATSLN